MEKEHANVKISYEMLHAIWLVKHPNATLEIDGTLFKYDIKTNKFLYRNPKNKHYVRWYFARGMQQHFQQALDLGLYSEV